MSRVMKDSGIQWIGEIPEDWTRARIKNLQDNTHPYPIGDGDHGQIKPDDYQDEGIPYIRVQNLGRGTPLLLDDVVYISEEVNNNNKKSILHPGDILIAKTGATFGKTGIIPDDMEQANTTSSVGKVTVGKDFSNKYVFYCLGSDVCYKQMELIASQKSAQPGFNIEDLVDFYIPLPPAEEQQKIADFLDKKCSKINEQKANYEKSIELLKEYKQSLITKAIIGHPKVKLKYIIDGKLQYGANSSGIEYNKDLPRYVRITDIDGDNLKDDDKLSLTEEEAKDFILQDGDILFARSGGTVGKTFRYKSDFGLCGFAGYLIRAKFENPELSQYVYNFTKSSLYENWKNGIFIQSTIQNIGADKYSLLQIPIPTNHDDIVKINKIIKTKCSKIDKVIFYREQMIEKLEEYKKSLIYESVTGKKEIK